MMKKQLLILLAIPFLVGCGNISNSSSTSSSSTSSSFTSSDEESSSSSSSLSDKQAKTVTIDLLGDSSRVDLTDGSNLSHTDPHNAFMTLLNEEVDLFSSVDVENCYFNQYYQEDDKTTLRIGTKNASGSMTFHFNYEVIAYSVEVQAYGTYDTYAEAYYFDTAANIKIDNEYHDLSFSDTSVLPEKHIFSKEYDSPINSLSLANEGIKSRVFVNSLTFTYYAE